jgi:Zn-dependent protease with chaperone function
MRKVLTLIIAALFLAGCAAAPTQKAYVVPQDVKDRVLPLFDKTCRAMDTGGYLYLHEMQEINAWVDPADLTGIHITLGALRYDDDTVTFILAHEVAHMKLNHMSNRKMVSGGVTVVMMAVNVLVPGAGLLNHAVNPAVVNNFSKPQELEADKLASDTCLKLGIPISKQLDIMNELRKVSENSGGGFWDQHPSFADRISNIQKAPNP